MNTASIDTNGLKMISIGEQIIDAWNSKMDENILPFYAHDFVVEDITAGNVREGWEGVSQWKHTVLTAFPNLSYTLLHDIENEGKLVLHWLAKGNHQGPLMKIPATGKNVFMHGMTILEFEDGKIKNGQVMWDLAGVLRQIGLLPQISH